MIETPGASQSPVHAQKLWPCDIVMAGGVTSGIIYPGAVAEIAKHYSFHSIGGTSVGAIAAVGAAAAEYRRRKHATFEGFEVLAKLHEQLGSVRDGHTRLFHLFTPENDTQGLFALLRLISGEQAFKKGKDFFGFALAQPLVAAAVLAVAALGVLTIGWLLLTAQYLITLAVLPGFLALAIGAAAGAFWYLLRYRWLPAFRDNNYGVCTGKTGPGFAGAGDSPAPFLGLTPWIHSLVQTISGRTENDDPLTFGDLWRAPQADGGPTGPTDGRSIELAMITSDISRNRVAQLPFLEWPSHLYFCEATLNRFFPDNVVDWMKKRGKTRPTDQDDPKVIVPEGMYRLPAAEDLPIVFAARLSLSFPVLLSAVPLWTPDFSKGDARNGFELRKVWFSDGGLISNFPIHFFDSPIPSRPTFCLNLVGFNSGVANEPTRPMEGDRRIDLGGMAANYYRTTQAAAREGPKPIFQARSPGRASAAAKPAAAKPPSEWWSDATHDQTIDLVAGDGDPKPGSDVWGMIEMARRNDMAPVPFVDLDPRDEKGKDTLALIPFVVSLFNTARHWSDNQMLYAPGTRDRVVHVALKKGEGGLNLDMPAKTIADLDYRGRAAGMLIAARFNPDAKVDPETGEVVDPAFPNHRWVRYRSFMAAFERLAERFRVARTKSDAEAAKRTEHTINEMIEGKAGKRIGYEAPEEARPYYKKATRQLGWLATGLKRAQQADEANTFDAAKQSGSGRMPPGAAPRPKIRAVFRPLADNDPLG